MAVKRSRKFSLWISIGFHSVLIALLFVSLEKTILVPATPAPQAQPPVIDAVMVNTKALQKERERLKAIEQQKQDQEREREKALLEKEQQAKEKQAQEEAQLAALKEQKLLQQKEMEAQQAKLKAEQASLEKIKKQKADLLAEKKKIETEKKKAAEAAKKAEVAKKTPVEETKVEEQTPPETAEVSEETIARDAAHSQQAQWTHAALIQSKINQNWRKPIGFDLTGYKCKLAVKLMPTGDVMEVQVIQSSGSLEFDRSAEVAVRKASPLPMPEDPRLASEFRQFSFTFRPEAA